MTEKDELAARIGALEDAMILLMAVASGSDRETRKRLSDGLRTIARNRSLDQHPRWAGQALAWARALEQTAGP